MKVTSQIPIPGLWHLQMTMSAAQAEDGVEEEATVETVHQMHESFCAKLCVAFYTHTRARARARAHTHTHTHTHTFVMDQW